MKADVKGATVVGELKLSKRRRSGYGAPPWNQSSVNEVIELWMRGEPVKSICEKTGRTRQSISSLFRTLRRNGVNVPTRPQGRPKQQWTVEATASFLSKITDDKQDQRAGS